MSRRDTIIVAVLINTGLLAVLFMMAIQTDFAGESPTPYTHDQVIAEAEKPMRREVIYEEPGIISTISSEKIDEMIQTYAVTETHSQHQDNPRTLTLPETRDLLLEETKVVEVVVKKGDFLEKIAKANGTTVSAIVKANQMSSPRIDVGQKLKIPVGTITAKPPQPPKNEVASSDAQYYTLKSGDNPWKIAKQFHVGFGELLKMNKLDEEKARNLKPGDVLRVK